MSKNYYGTNYGIMFLTIVSPGNTMVL